MAEGNCIICGKSLDSAAVRKIKGETLKHFIQASKQRKDGKHSELKKHDSLNIHVNCCKVYTSQSKIHYAVRKLEDASTSTATGTRSTGTPKFDFQNLCFICEEDASDIFLKKQERLSANKRQRVHIVTNNSTRNTLISLTSKATDTFSLNVYARLSELDDLVALGARYHQHCQKKLYTKCNVPEKTDSETPAAKAAKFISTYILQHKDECQFCVKNILENFDSGEWVETKYLKKHLKKIFDDDVIIHKSRDGPIITFINAGEKMLTEMWYKNRKQNTNEERKRLVHIAGKIILEDIRSQFYDTTSYPAPDSFLEDIKNDVPETLEVLLNTIILDQKRAVERYNNKITSIAHAIIAATRPRSYLSSLQLGLAATLNKKYGSKELLQMLNSLGFCATYEESLLFEASVLSHPQNLKYDDAYFQFVFDNADHNLNTLDGKNTFHAMGGIKIITPYNSISGSERVPRLQKIPSTEVIGAFGKIPLHTFSMPSASGMQKIIIKICNDMSPMSLDIQILPADFLWICGKATNKTNFEGWNGFMENLMKKKYFERSKVHFLPFINHPPSSHNTIYTVLLEAKRRTADNQKDCFVTFDQPLYYKAREILACCQNELSSVHVRLGGFHLLMSFLGSIGFIMSGSGLKELFCEIYAENSVDKMLTGHAYARAVRGHILAHLALGQILLNSLLSDTEAQLVHEILQNIGDETLNAIEATEFTNIVQKFRKHVKNIEKNGPTAQLWVQYFNMVTVAKQFIEAERTGNWKLHLESVRKMMPFFHASGHYLYAKSCHLYLQDMYEIEEKMDPLEYNKFTEKGFFTIRRTDKFWAGIWSDMAIEQILMRSMKASGGLTHGRGITDSSLTKWTLTMAVVIDVTESIQNFCNVNFSTTEQHVDARPSRISRDTADLDKLLKFLSVYEPFACTNAIFSISSGCKGDDSVNCYKAFEIGIEMINNTIGSNFKQLKYNRKNRVLSLQSATLSKTIKNENIIIDPTLIFQRIAIAMEGKSDLKNFVCYELAPFPLSLFDNAMMRKTAKAKLYDFFIPLQSKPFDKDCSFVIDGGFLLHRVVWRQNETFSKIINFYIDYVKRHFNSTATIVFDGYPDDKIKCTKTAERERRQLKQVCREIIFDLSMIATVPQEKFLSNDKNKKRLISILREKLEAEGFKTKQAIGDADALIVKTAIQLSDVQKPSVIVAEDIDVLVIMTQTTPADKEVYFFKPGKEQITETIYSTESFSVKSLKNLICFIHAFTGCDTTSAFYKQGKAKIIKALEKNHLLRDSVSVFNFPNADKQEIKIAGEKVICALYGGTTNIQLNELRYKCFKKCSRKNLFNLAAIPPTESAAIFHSFRVYHQVQEWQNNSKNPLEWGWHTLNNALGPAYAEGPLVPDDILKDIRCRCAKECKKTCGCVKHGLRCSEYCTNCQGKTCKNHEIESIELDEEKDEDIVIDELFQNANDDIELSYSDIESETDDSSIDLSMNVETETENQKKRKRHDL